jgi:ABC-type antimicrobial peptide transport system permease subunit
MRTFLTVTGVTIGITSIVAILSLATGASNIIVQQVDETGGTIAVVRPNQESANSLEALANQQVHTTASTLTLADTARIASLNGAAHVAPIMLVPSAISSENNQPLRDQTVIGTNSELLGMSGITIREGQFDDTNETTVAVGPQLSVNLFGTEESLGKTVIVRGHEYRVGAILEREQSTVNFNGFDFNTALIMSTAQLTNLVPNAPVQQITVQADSVANLDRLVIDTNKALLVQHANEQDFAVLTGAAIAEPTSQLFFIIAGVTGAIAAISLFVGGIGIMNIMLVNVAERTREIGIRKALGATNTDIVWQFLIESILMSFIGGIIGCVLGFGLAFGISLFLTFDPVITWQAAVSAVGIGIGIGVVFGIYPAVRASQKDPIESLKEQL